MVKNGKCVSLNKTEVIDVSPEPNGLEIPDIPREWKPFSLLRGGKNEMNKL